jgi:hypothetical protein
VAQGSAEGLESDVTDVAYIVGPPGRTVNEELRYSLRSVDKNLGGVGEVVMFGSAPAWVKTRKIGGVKSSAVKHADARANLRNACMSESISDPFWFFNDDFFVMKPMDGIPSVDRGEIIKQDRITEQMRQAMRACAALNLDPPFLYYECHTPILVYKRHMLDVMRMLPDRGLVKTVYMNLMSFPSQHTGNAKVYPSTPRVWEDWPLLSTTNGTFATGDVGHFIRSKFPEPSRWEWQDGPGLP